jgi:4-hydroxy-tetrahydrodipicolinate reductase
MIRIALLGASGRMGRALLVAARAREDLEIVGLVDRLGAPDIGKDGGELAGVGRIGLPIGADEDAALARAQVAVDFSAPDAAPAHLAACRRHKVALLIGTTGLPASLPALVAEAAREIPIIVASNTSLGVTLLAALVRAAARSLPADFDIEIFEAHHRAKRDAPSGTALTLGAAAAAGRGSTLEKLANMQRETGQVRRDGEIGFAVMRGGDVVGEHAVRFLGIGETLTLGHQATDRAIFARGALRAAAWLAGQAPGKYEMADVLGLKSVI